MDIIASVDLHTSQLRTGKVCNSTAQAIFEGDLRLPVERCFCLLVGEHRAIDVALARGLMRRMQLPADGLAEDRNEVIEARLRLRAEVVGRVRVLRRQRVHDAVRDVARIVKSRVWPPSPKIISGSPFATRFAKMLMTPPSPLSPWRSP